MSKKKVNCPHPATELDRNILPDLVELLLATSRDGVFLSNAEGLIQQVNGPFCQMTGYGEGELLGRSIATLLSDESNAVFSPDMLMELARERSVWLGEVRARCKDGALVRTALRLAAICQENRVCQILGQIGRSGEMGSPENGAGHDHLTGLPERPLFEDRLHQSLIQSRRAGRSVGVLQLDLDRFKLINESLGHAVGDLLLREVAGRLLQCLRTSDSISRIGPDTFVMLLSDLNQPAEAVRNASIVARKVFESINGRLELDGNEIEVSAAMGITIFPQDGVDVATLMKNAETAMNHARAKGWNNYQFFSSEMTLAARNRFVMESHLRRAIERQELRLFYQPQVSLESGEVVGAEALIRWIHPERGLVSPGEFIPVAEETGLIVPIGEWVLRTACRQCVKWRAEGLPCIRLGVNISPMQFRKQDLALLVAEVLRETGMPPEQLELEITESAIVEDVQRAVSALTSIERLGVKLSIDDFGTGYSSLSQLHQFPFKTLKIDRSFVQHINGNPADTAIISAIVAMAHGLNLNVIAEGLETPQQLEMLKKLQCQEMQGFLFSRPLPEEQFTELLRNGSRLE